MARVLTEIDVFIGACGDVEDDVYAVKAAIDEVNKLVRGFVFSAKYWKESAYSSIGSVKAQHENNMQLLESADIYIFLAHSRIGTVVESNKTGFEIEFEYATSKKKHNESTFIQMYEKRSGYGPDVDIDQLSKVKDFLNDVAKQKGLIATYKDLDELKSRVRQSLSMYADKYGRSNDKGDGSENTISAQEKSSISLTNIEDEEMGFYDYLEKIEESFDRATAFTKYYSDRQEEMVKNIQSYNSKIKYIDLSSMSTKDRSRLINEAADYFEKFINEVNPQFPDFRSDLIDGMLASIGIVKEGLEVQGGVQGLDDFLNSVGDIRESIFSFLSEHRRMMESFNTVPRLTTKMKKASRALGTLFSDYESTLERAVELADEALAIPDS